VIVAICFYLAAKKLHRKVSEFIIDRHLRFDGPPTIVVSSMDDSIGLLRLGKRISDITGDGEIPRTMSNSASFDPLICPEVPCPL